MIGLQNAMLIAQWSVEDKAKAEGRMATEAEYAAAFRETFNRCVDAAAMHTMAQAEATKAVRVGQSGSLLRWLFG